MNDLKLAPVHHTSTHMSDDDRGDNDDDGGDTESDLDDGNDESGGNSGSGVVGSTGAGGPNSAVVGAGLGFLWFNTYPAQVFMGDVGALALGAALGVVAVITKNEILLALCGGIFVIEALSVMAQVASFKMTGKRVLKMAPIHHHFELKGWAEPKVIVRFWIISILLALITLSTLKLR